MALVHREAAKFFSKVLAETQEEVLADMAKKAEPQILRDLVH